MSYYGFTTANIPSIRSLPALLGLLVLAILFSLALAFQLMLHWTLLLQCLPCQAQARLPGDLLAFALCLPLYNNIKEKEALEHDIRSQIMRLVERRPGISASQAMDRIKVNRSTLIYHVNFMSKHRLVKVVSTNSGYRQFYPGHFEDHQIPQNSTPKAEFIYRLICRCPGATQTELAMMAQISKQAVQPHLSRLMLDNRVKWHRKGRTKYWFPSDN